MKIRSVHDLSELMNIEEVRQYCMSFPDATENLQWGDDLCFKIRGKIFAILALTAMPQKACFKCTPESFADLIERQDIHPAPYVGRYKWVMLDRMDALPTAELKELIGKSYEMVAANAPRAKRTAARRSSLKGKSRRGRRTPNAKLPGRRRKR
jgi:predicted DNA-binding protein (MmcQ/YjbR family)